MRFKTGSLKRLLFAITLFFCFSITTNAAGLSSASKRADRWEFAFQTLYLDSKDIDFKNGANAKLNDEMGWAFSVGYNYTENWEFNLDIGWTDVNYSGTRVLEGGGTEQVTGRINASNTSFSGIYNFSARRFTPFIGASIGWTFVDTNIANGPPVSGCWYDPWWGYVCDYYVPTKTATNFNYGAILGLRFDMSDKIFLKASAGKRWVDFSKTTNTPDFTIYRFDIGFMF